VNRKIIVAIILVMTLALIGLMRIQVYFIGDAVKVKEATFLRDVNQAMTQVVMLLEKEEMQRQFEYHLAIINKRANLFSVYDSINRTLGAELAQPMDEEEYAAFLRRFTLAQEKLQEMTFGYNQAMAAVKEMQPLRIDSIVRAELKKHGITTQYEIGIYSPTRNAMLFQKTGRFPHELLNKGFSFDMNPTIAPVRFADKLLIYFPHEKSYLIQQLSELLVVSSILLVVIILSFLATIFIIIRQKKLSEMKSDLVNNMTHEFKTPISTIRLACEALRDDDIHKSDVLYSTYINMIDEENKRLGVMAEQILQSAVMEKGELILKQDYLSLNDLVREVVASKLLQAKSRQGHIFTELKAERDMVLGDKVHLTNALLNLVDNALKYSDEAPQIVVKSRNFPNGIEILVQDNGVGISKSNQKRIFEKLYRVPTGNVHKAKGFGLGLSYVKAVVEKHGGMIGVNSELKKGSIFYFRLPLLETS